MKWVAVEEARVGLASKEEAGRVVTHSVVMLGSMAAGAMVAALLLAEEQQAGLVAVYPV